MPTQEKSSDAFALFVVYFLSYSLIVYLTFSDRSVWGILERRLKINFPEPHTQLFISFAYICICLCSSFLGGFICRNAKWASVFAVIGAFWFSVTFLGIPYYNPAELSFALTTMGLCTLAAFVGGDTGHIRRRSRHKKDIFDEAPAEPGVLGFDYQYCPRYPALAVKATVAVDSALVIILFGNVVVPELVFIGMLAMSLLSMLFIMKYEIRGRLMKYVDRMADQGKRVVVGYSFSEQLDAYSQICAEEKANDWPVMAIYCFKWSFAFILFIMLAYELAAT